MPSSAATVVIPFLTPLAELHNPRLKFASIQDIMKFVDPTFSCDENSVAYLQYFTPKHYVMCAWIEHQEIFLAEFPAFKQSVEQHAVMSCMDELSVKDCFVTFVSKTCCSTTAIIKESCNFDRRILAYSAAKKTEFLRKFAQDEEIRRRRELSMLLKRFSFWDWLFCKRKPKTRTLLPN